MVAAKPMCVAKSCVPCTSDGQCAEKLGPNPGVCMFHADGRCATDAEAIYVQNTTGCTSGSSGGTASLPFCSAQVGMDAVTAAKRVVVLRGPGALVSLSTPSAGAAITVVGQQGAVLAPGGAGPGVRVVAGGDVYLRGLTIRSGEEAGVVVDTGATLRMNRCIVKDNKKGGLLVSTNAGFDIANSVFDGNGPGFVAGTGSFGGAALGTSRAGGPARFRNNTVVNNKQVGVVCEQATQGISGLLFYQNTGGDQVNCTVTSSRDTSAGDPKLTGDYHLTSASPCRNAGSASDFPVDDIDGDARPSETGSDCGADEHR
jgi:hypothetical protein